MNVLIMQLTPFFPHFFSFTSKYYLATFLHSKNKRSFTQSAHTSLIRQISFRSQ